MIIFWPREMYSGLYLNLNLSIVGYPLTKRIYVVYFIFLAGVYSTIGYNSHGFFSIISIVQSTDFFANILSILNLVGDFGYNFFIEWLYIWLCYSFLVSMDLLFFFMRF